MSGYKHATVTISESEYRRLHDADMKDRFSRVAYNKANRDHEEAEALRVALQVFEERQHAFQQYIGGLENEIGQVEIETAQALMDQKADHNQELSVRIASLQEESAGALEAVSRYLSEQIESNQRRHVHQLAMVTKHLDALSGDIEHKTVMARQWLDAAVALRNFIETQYDHNRYLPGHFERLDIQMQQATENLQDDMLEAALLGAQQVYVECSQARLELERLTSEWQILFQDASKSVEELLGILIAGKIIPALDTLGRELPIEVNLDQWSDHGHTTLIRHVRYLRSRLRTEADSLTSAELIELIKNVIPGLKKEFNTLVYEARLAVIYSQIRINIADIAIQALERQGFTVNEHGFVENNMRKPYLISLQNIEGSQVLIHVDPIHNAESANDLVIESQDTVVRTESELRSRSQEILRSLTHYGLRVGPVSTGRGVQAEGFNPAPGREQTPSRSVVRQDSHHD
jgi:hypothetical protein